MKIVHNKKFDFLKLDYQLGPGVYQDYEFHKCTFDYATVVFAKHPKDRPVLRNIRLFNCKVAIATVGPLVVEECLVENLKTGKSPWVYGALFKNTLLRGRFGSFMFTGLSLGPGKKEQRIRQLFERADHQYYENVDWALDISQAEFYNCEIENIPGHLIRRDPGTQVLIWRHTLQKRDWKRLKFPHSGYKFSLRFLAESDLPSMVLIAGKRHPRFELFVQQLNELRKLGIAESD